MHGCGKDYERRSHCKSEEILKGHKMSPSLRLTMTSARTIAVTIVTGRSAKCAKLILQLTDSGVHSRSGAKLRTAPGRHLSGLSFALKKRARLCLRDSRSGNFG